MPDLERYFTAVPVETRSTSDGRRTIGGYAAVFDKLSERMNGFVERVASAAFNKSRGDGWPGVQCRYNHDNNMLLGMSDSGTLRLSVDDTGLVYEVDVPQSRGDVFELVERGDVRKSSFAFRSDQTEDEWGVSEQGYPQRTLLSVPLVDVAPVNSPAYPDSTAGLRSLAAHFDADFDEVRRLADANELRRFFVRTDGPPPKASTFGPAARAELLGKQNPPAA